MYVYVYVCSDLLCDFLVYGVTKAEVWPLAGVSLVLSCCILHVIPYLQCG